MKKLLLIALVALSIPLFAQNTPDSLKPHFYMGIGANVNSVWLSNQNTYGEPELNYKTKLGFGANLSFGMDYPGHWGWKTEIGYAQMGQKYDDLQYDLPTTRDITMSFIQIPFLLKFRTGGNFRFYADLGPQLDILLSAKQDYVRGGETPKEYNGIDVAKKDIKDRYQQVQGFIRADAGVEIGLSDKLFLNAGVSGAFGITDANDPQWRFYNTTDRYYISHNMYLGLNVGLNFNF